MNDNANSTDSFGATPLIISACNRRSPKALSVMDLLLKHKAKVNKRNCFGWTALHYAARTGRKEMVQRLLEAGARSTIKNWKRKTAVDIAREKGRHEIAQLIENGLPQVEDTGLTKSAR
ncbi:MAG: ankyrin repeat domain-containing protein [Candidatus Dependentiae bacterium]